MINYQIKATAALNITLTALDINAENNSCTHPRNIAFPILDALKLPEEGSLHAEKFHTKLNIYLDTIANDSKRINRFKVLFNTLEQLCEHCVKYESKKGINYFVLIWIL